MQTVNSINSFTYGSIYLANSAVSKRNIISLLVLSAPFTLGESSILNINSIYVSWFAIIVLFWFNFDNIFLHKRILNNNYFIPILILTLSFFLSIFFGLNYTDNPNITISGNITKVYTIKWVFTFVITQLLLLYLIYLSINSFDDLKYILKSYLLSGFIVNALAIYTIALGIYGADQRLVSVFKDPNYLARFELFIIVISLVVLLYVELPYAKKGILIINILLSFILMYFTYSRASLLTLPFIIVLITLYRKSKVYKYILITFIFVIFSYLIIKSSSFRLGNSNLDLLSSLLDTSNLMRVMANYFGFMFFLDNPIFGIGYHNYYYTFIQSEFYNPLTANMEYIHSWLFTLLGEQGLLGLIPFLWILILIYKNIIKCIKENLVPDFKWIGIVLLCLISTLLLNGLFFPDFFAELNLILFFGIIGGYLKVYTIISKVDSSLKR